MRAELGVSPSAAGCGPKPSGKNEVQGWPDSVTFSSLWPVPLQKAKDHPAGMQVPSVGSMVVCQEGSRLLYLQGGVGSTHGSTLGSTALVRRSRVYSLSRLLLILCLGSANLCHMMEPSSP